MRNRLVFLCVVAIAILVLSPKTAAEPEAVPNISGVWQTAKRQNALFPNGGAPLRPWGEAKFKAANLQTNDPMLACLPEGVPRFMLMPVPMEIFQVPTRVVIIHEGVQTMRQIYLNRQHRDDLYPTYSGDSIGKWEGNTLVVDTIGFNDKTWIDNFGLPHSEAMHLVERIRRVGYNTLLDDMTIDDPMAFTKPITVQEVYKLKPSWEIQEYVCTENNKYTYEGN